MKGRSVWALTLALLGVGQATAPAPASVTASATLSAQDLFDEVIYELASGYNGPSRLRASDLRRSYLPRVQALCGGKAECASSQAYPLLRQLVADLKDPHTHLFSPAEIQEAQQVLSGEPSGQRTFGAITEALGTGGRVVAEVLPDSAAARAGWRVGDVLHTANGVPLDGEAGQKALARAAGRGTAVRFSGLRLGQPLITTLTASPLTVSPVSLSWREGKVVVVRLRHFFMVGVAQQVHGAIGKAQSAGAQGIVLDLRWNGGGLVEEFMLSAGAFTAPAPLFMKTRFHQTQIGYRAGEYLVNGNAQGQPLNQPVRYSGPLAVLVNRHSASAAEFLARSVLTRPRTWLFGEPTAGLADTASRFVPLQDGSALQLTFATMLDADGKALAARLQPQAGGGLNLSELTRTGRDELAEQAASWLRQQQR
ncbi:S41 family peptidase [Deinococcus puniceus]|uniref:Tail specific protease domain-containing protein n=1 Tax=Deinococcus puniceus TaxID=1182568 RepID=A0A172T776_9DEIO|nr:S41 family peptidase [Deinococcus puniceus]ANE42840.1 hypothetical protein SU48_02650 [Deinococcus puniceus]